MKTTIEEWLHDVARGLPARVQKCGVLAGRALVVRLARADTVLYLYCAPGAGLRRVAWASQSPQTEYPHAAWLGTHTALIEGAELLGVEKLAGEDVLCMRFSTGVALMVHFFGHSGNAVVVAGDGTILAAWHLCEHHQTGTRYQRTPPVPHASVIEVCDAAALVAEVTACEREDIRRAVQHHVQAERARLARRLEKIAADEEHAGRAAAYRHQGELLRAYYHLLRPHMAEVRVPDYEHPGDETVIALDARKTPQENVRWYFHQAEKWARAPAAIARRRRETAATLAAVEARLRAVETMEETAALRALLPRARAAARPARTERALTRFRRLRSSDDLLIIAGRSARDNDELTCRLARGNDVWMHTRNRPGAHVIVRAERGHEVPPRTLREAAQVCVHCSKVADGEVEEVLYTLRKHVSKPKGAKAGMVLVAGGKTITVKERAAAMDEWVRTHPWEQRAEDWQE